MSCLQQEGITDGVAVLIAHLAWHRACPLFRVLHKTNFAIGHPRGTRYGTPLYLFSS